MSKMPIEKIYEVAASVQGHFNLRIMEFESYVKLAKDLVFELVSGLQSSSFPDHQATICSR